MKFRNLLFGTMIACTFAACSNEDDPIVGGNLPGEVEGPATLSIMVDKVKTKAVDTDITSLNVLVFKGEGDAAVLEVNHAATEGEISANAINKMAITAGNKRVLVLANVNAAQFAVGTATYANVLSATKKFTDAGYVEVNGNLSMNSRVYDVTLTVSKDNCLGFTATGDQVQVTGRTGVVVTTPIKLYRNVSKISIKSLANVAAANGAFKNGKLTVKEVFLLHGKETTKLVGVNGAEWGTTEGTSSNYINGASNDTYAGWVDYMKDKTLVYQYLTTPVYTEYKNYVEAASGSDGQYEEVCAKYFYAYENTGIGTLDSGVYTLLVLKGDYTYEDVNGTPKTETDRYYPVAVGKDIVAAQIPDNFTSLNVRDGKYSGVLRNLWYKIDLKVSGPGYKTPFGPKPNGGDEPGGADTFLSVAYEVVEFGDVTQNGGNIE